MRRLLAVSAAIILSLGLATTALAATPLTHNGRVVISTEGDVTIPAGEHADVVVVVNGAAHIAGEVNTLVVVEGSADLAGARIETVVAVTSSIEVGDGTVISGELQQLDSSVHQTGNVQIAGGITDLSGWFFRTAAVLAPALFLLWLGFGLATIAGALLFAALAARQVREAGRLISSDPLMTGLIGFLSIIAIPVAAILLMVTVIGAPLGLGVLFALLPLLAYAGYLTAAIWTGEWILRRTGPGADRERPFLAAILGVVVLGALGLVPVLGLIVTVASLLGFGALIRIAFRTLRGTPRPPSARRVTTMKVLVTVASRHGSTSMIGDCIREELNATGVSAYLFEPAEIRGIGEYDAVVIGSAVYGGRWLGPARKFIKRFEAELASKPVWLFSSGPIGDPAKPTQPSADALELAHRLEARDHQVFEGRLERDLLSLAERAVVRVMGAESGDYRPWVAITVWARSIAASLKAELAQPVGAG